ncbi:roadblock/LC7 domain-containing protein [Streptomyces durbertensis]|uniref:Roadblock/LC7 domain-containing protein n=1 Tax=Streptomyces durbertensis TaxID=2448886 RepID=A0ABR6EII3_9ACTN|nr:roadblock/LC7 domain-containing protein [Streptomyces durbertensis]MBB1245152.1 roadblock/LC7 domain-containing protein [Streptomyces durbertensis]
MTVHKRPVNPLNRDMSWVLEPLLVLPGVVHALVLSSDGMVQGASPGLSREASEGASAMMSALQGAGRAVAASFSGDEETKLRQVVVETDAGFVFAIPAGAHSVLAVFANRSVAIGVVAHHMQIQVATLGRKVMDPEPRVPDAQP